MNTTPHSEHDSEGFEREKEREWPQKYWMDIHRHHEHSHRAFKHP
jgi:hypothetical protein